MGLQARDLGARNTNERGETMYNQCFYLSLARCWLGGCDNSAVSETALQLKRVIEAAVLRAHPEWAGSQVGDDVQAFSDFLFFAMPGNALLSELAVAVFDSFSGGVEIYVGNEFPHDERSQRSNLLPIKYIPGPPGHYLALVPTGQGPTLAELKRALDAEGVRYVVTES